MKAINKINELLENWYKTAKDDYGVEGSGRASLDESGSIRIDFSENGSTGTWLSTPYWMEEDNAAKWVFDCWCESAFVEN